MFFKCFDVKNKLEKIYILIYLLKKNILKNNIFYYIFNRALITYG